jgi:hypothetical protein
MIKIYLVSWILVQWSITSPPTQKSEYGVVSNTMLAIAYYKEEKTFHKKEFNKIEEAKLFIDKAPKEDSTRIVYFDYAYCTDMKLDSTWVDTTMLRIKFDF